MSRALRLLNTGAILAALATTQLMADYVYWTDRDGHAIRRGALDGSSLPETILDASDGLSQPRGLGIDVARGKMYWADATTRMIRRANLDGSDTEDLITTGLSFPADLELDLVSRKIYWTDTALGEIRRSDLDGSSVETVRSGLTQPYYFDLDPIAQKICWGENDNTVIHSASLDGSGPIVDVVTGQLRVRDIALSTGTIYWTDRESSLVRRAPLDGTSPPETLFSAVSTDGKPHGLALDSIGQMAYWTDTRTNWIARGAMDGSGQAEVIYSNLSDAWDIELAQTPVPEPSIVTILLGCMLFGLRRSLCTIWGRVHSA